MAKNYVSNKQTTPRLFSNELIEKLSHVHPTVPIVLYLPFILYFLFSTFKAGIIQTSLIPFLFLSGVLFWSLMEYIIHRFVFHYEPKSALGQQIHYLSHGIHHDYPKDPMRLVMPPAVSIPLALFFYGLFWIILGGASMAPIFSGFVFGYLAYDMIHYATHHFTMKETKMGLWLKHYHSKHHYQDENYSYGVSSPLWDYVFRTRPPQTEKV
ncbi:sterol desaturase family protein [candidate division KSB1 bacterium]|nr:sterol desaturase family protein [candidate division KSB1 bacterium]TDI94465.1 MAG: fatty acid hydroxylase [Caldithrix sp.]